MQAGDDAGPVELRLKSLRNPARKIEHTALGEGVSHLLVYHRVYPSKRKRQKTPGSGPEFAGERCIELCLGSKRDAISIGSTRRGVGLVMGDATFVR